MIKVQVLKTTFEAIGNQSLSIAEPLDQGTPYQGKILLSPKFQADPSFFQVSLVGDSTLAIRHEFQPQVPPEGLKNTKCKKGTPLVRPPIPYVPPTDLHEMQKTEKIKVELPNGTKFPMPTYRSGNNKEYLVHVTAVLRLVEQKGTIAKVKEAFAALVKIRKEMSPFFNFPEDESVAKKEARKKKLSAFNESLKAKKSFAVEQAQKTYELFRCFVVGEGSNTMGQDRKRDAH